MEYIDSDTVDASSGVCALVCVRLGQWRPGPDGSYPYLTDTPTLPTVYTVGTFIWAVHPDKERVMLHPMTVPATRIFEANLEIWQGRIETRAGYTVGTVLSQADGEVTIEVVQHARCGVFHSAK